ncbi:unnamed protein product [Periconia digitata]|uniref:Uncharacterized protein n=1 Tax=Periconia digitata TaxID=1303443 RepID=A0A9W4U668_9PLEO|nr:unnamed protein product [Periconia digitata]
MPPKRGRPAKSAVAAAAVATSTPKRRGRPSLAEAAAAVATPASIAQPKKRRRPSKALEDVVAPTVAPAAEELNVRRGGRARKLNEMAAPPPAELPKRGVRARQQPAAPAESELVVTEPKRRGRAAKTAQEVPAADPALPKRRGRAPKAAEVPTVPSSPPKRKGRPAKAATLDLNRVAGSPRVSKRNAVTKKATAPTPPAPRMNPLVRSKLRTRVAPSPKTQPQEVLQPKKRVGRPPKNAVATPTKKPADRMTKGGRVTKSTNTAKTAASKPKATKTTKTVASKAAPRTAAPVKPRKRRGITIMEVPDKHAKYLQDVLKGLLEQDKADARAAEEEAEMADDEEDVPPPQEQTEEAERENADSDYIASKLAIAAQLNGDAHGGAEEDDNARPEDRIIDLVDGAYGEDQDELDLPAAGKPATFSKSRSNSVDSEHLTDAEAAEEQRVATEQVIVEMDIQDAEELEPQEQDRTTGVLQYHQNQVSEVIDITDENQSGSEQENTGGPMRFDDMDHQLIIPGEMQPSDEDNTPINYNSLFDESPLATSTPAVCASSKGPAPSFSTSSVISSAFPSTFG